MTTTEHTHVWRAAPSPVNVCILFLGTACVQRLYLQRRPFVVQRTLLQTNEKWNGIR